MFLNQYKEKMSQKREYRVCVYLIPDPLKNGLALISHELSPFYEYFLLLISFELLALMSSKEKTCNNKI